VHWGWGLLDEYPLPFCASCPCSSNQLPPASLSFSVAPSLLPLQVSSPLDAPLELIE
jgi:hypothetical protein